MNALCAVDGSKCSMRGVEALGTLFRGSLREVILLHIMDTSFLDPVMKKGGAKTEKTKKILATLESEGRNILKNAQAHAARALSQRIGGLVRIRPVLTKGHAAYSIVKQAEKWKPHIIILGSRGFHDIHEYLLGSVSRKVLSHSPCPVLLVKDPIRTPAQVVLAVDGSHASKRAADYLKTWMPKDSISVHVLSVVPQVSRRVRSLPYANALGDAWQKTSSRNHDTHSVPFNEKEF